MSMNIDVNLYMINNNFKSLDVNRAINWTLYFITSNDWEFLNVPKKYFKMTTIIYG